MTEATQPNSDPGRWIRFALVMLPAGTILLGIASFGIWQWKKDQAADRSFKYAMALRRPISVEGIQRHADIVREALGKPDRYLSIPGYLESTMGAENMGYTVRRARFGDDRSTIDAELTGKTRPREIVMALALYSEDATRFGRTSLAIAELMSIAHEVTGQSVARSLRFAVIPDTPEAVAQLQDGLRRDNERVMYLFVLGAPDINQLGRVTRALDTAAKGTRVVARPATLTPQESLPSAHELKALLLHAAERP
ncbi:hypothetical protein [Prosthecobacter sp.]|uniref:hypothetical protein n=1 Tax=Prosthecobacter sp. TaxID=1965333 RepID=UPI002ABAC0E4|nr:hypothetical protein [Prosthecobacter sp.]MDZ4405747.1 hypothetical protein [Prosthecobacter sp.]